jgi:2-methylcitrate dehydratase PrpD
LSNPLVILADTARDWQLRPLAPPVAWATRRALLDWFATTVPGCVKPPASVLAPAMGPQRGNGLAVCYVDGRTGSARHAALLNATASHTVEFDDIFKDGGYHPGSSTIAAALAIAQDRGQTLDELHRAIIAGYEVGCRISLAIQPSHYKYWHTTATIGTIGAATSSAMLLGCDATGIAHAIALASSFASGHQQNLQAGAAAKALHAGHAAEAGMLAAIVAANGGEASLESLHGEKGFAAATSQSTGNWEKALDGIGHWTPIVSMTVKNHGCCGHIFPALDGILTLRRETRFKLEDVQSIHVVGYRATAEMCNRPNPETATDARFSTQYCVAAQLLLGKVRLEAFEPAALANPDIRRLAAKISVGQDDELTAAYPAKRMARITVTTKDGRVLERFQETRKGDPEDPLSDEELVAKFDELTAGVVARDDANALRETILYGGEVPGQLPFTTAARSTD